MNLALNYLRVLWMLLNGGNINQNMNIYTIIFKIHPNPKVCALELRSWSDSITTRPMGWSIKWYLHSYIKFKKSKP